MITSYLNIPADIGGIPSGKMVVTRPENVVNDVVKILINES